MNKKILLIFIFAFLIRLIALNQSLWLDEAVTANVVKNLGFFQIITKFSPNDFHSPLYYLFMKLWTNFFGYSEVALRMPSILFSLATGWIIYLIGGVWSAVFFLFNPLIIYYSQEARMYMMATFLLTTSLYFLLTSLRVNEFKKRNLILFNLLLILSFYSFYGSIFLIISIFLYLLYKKQHKTFFVSCFVFLISFLFISPLLYKQLVNSKITLANVTNWSLVLGKANIKNLLLIPIKFSIGRISFEPKWIYYAISGIWTTFVWFFIIIQKLKVKSLLFLLIFPLILGFIASFFAPMLQYFRFIYLIPIMSILLSFSLSQSHRFHRFGVVMAGGFIIFSLVYLLNPAFYREDWKSLVKSLPENKPIYMIASSSDSVKYYNKALKIKELRELTPRLEKQITVIPYTAEIYGFDYQKILQEKNYRLVDKKNFRGLITEEYSRQ